MLMNTAFGYFFTPGIEENENKQSIAKIVGNGLKCKHGMTNQSFSALCKWRNGDL